MNLRNSLLRGFAPAVSALALAAMVSTSAHAASFAISPNQSGQLGFGGTTAAGFANTSTGGQIGYNFVYTSVAASKGSTGNVGNQGAVDLDAATITDPNNQVGAGFLALDGDFQTSAVILSLTGLQANTQYSLQFDFAATQQLFSVNAAAYGSCANIPANNILCDSPFDAGVTVAANGSTIGSVSEGTIATPLAPQSFGGWESVTYNFIAASSGNEQISFTGTGFAQNVPSFALVDGINVNVNPAPEPNSLILLGTGLAGLGGLVRSRFAKATTKA
jgi:hypothetical protein